MSHCYDLSVPSYHVYICDRCARRVEGDFFALGWCQIDVMHGLEDDRPDLTEPPEVESYLLCHECSPAALGRLRDSVRETAGAPTH